MPPAINEMTNSTSATKKTIFAIPTAAPAIPPKPRTAAISAIIRIVTTRLSIEMLGIVVPPYQHWDGGPVPLSREWDGGFFESPISRWHSCARELRRNRRAWLKTEPACPRLPLNLVRIVLGREQ